MEGEEPENLVSPNTSNLNNRQPESVDEGEMVVDSVSSRPGQVTRRVRGQAGQQGGGLHLWAPGGSTADGDVIWTETSPSHSESAQFVDYIRNRRLPFPREETAQSAPREADHSARGGSTDGFLPISGSSQLQKEEEENRSLRDRFHCKICLERPIDSVFEPCYHRFSCRDCSERSLQEQELQGLPPRCPVCRCQAYVTSVRT